MTTFLRVLFLLASVVAVSQATVQAADQPPPPAKQQRLTLPTGNDHLFRGESEKFYMYVHRKFEGVTSKAWTAGKYGFVRNLKRTEDGVIGTRFHEGIDIKPIKRDRSNNPLDEVMAVAAGTVAYVNPSASRSNYGKYIVIEHLWKCGPIYSLYAHLSKVSVKPGDHVTQGQAIGQMGYTGAGINRERSHLHLEFNLMLCEKFTQWHKKHLGGTNYHGMHNGMNMAGLDIAGYYIAQKRDPSLTLPRFVRTQPVYYQVTLPRTAAGLEILRRYPWLAQGSEKAKSPSWEIAFTASGFPVSIVPSQRVVSDARITSVIKCRSKHSYHTKGFVHGTGYRASLTERGKRFIELLTGSFDSDSGTKNR